MEIKMSRTPRDFIRGDFKDEHGHDCSIQKSSAILRGGAIWLGLMEGTHTEGYCLARMHLTQDHVRALLPLLTHFVETGELPDPE